MKKEILDLFHRISLPFNDGKGQKEEEILSFCSENKLKANYVKNIGIIVEPEDEVKIVVISHIDLIPKFNKGFKKGKKSFVENDFLIGALDNTITNAIALLIAKENLNSVRFVFTEGEETGLHGIKNYLKEYGSKDHFYINLDVTNEGWEHGVSIEYDNPSFTLCKKVLEAGSEETLFFTKNRVCDDLDMVIMKGFTGFSLCLPTDGIIHSWKNKTKLSYLALYKNALKEIINLILSLDTEVVFKDDCDYVYNLDTAIKCYESVNKYKEENQNSFDHKDLFADDDFDIYDIFNTHDLSFDSSNDILIHERLEILVNTFCDERSLDNDFGNAILKYILNLINEAPYTTELDISEIFIYLDIPEYAEVFISKLEEEGLIVRSETYFSDDKILWKVY